MVGVLVLHVKSGRHLRDRMAHRTTSGNLPAFPTQLRNAGYGDASEWTISLRVSSFNSGPPGQITCDSRYRFGFMPTVIRSLGELRS